MKTPPLLALCTMMLTLSLGTSSATQTAKDKDKAKPKGKDSSAEKVIQFCKNNLDKQIGNGECWSLVNDALLSANMLSSGSYKDSPNKDDYVWGTQVYYLEIKKAKPVEEITPKMTVKPGDIIQFRDAKFAGRRADGGTYEMTTPHHSAVVTAVANNGKSLTVLHQNWGGKKSVTELTFNLNDLQVGWVRVYHPMPK